MNQILQLLGVKINFLEGHTQELQADKIKDITLPLELCHLKYEPLSYYLVELLHHFGK